ncbi:hypothetical protein GLOTRDRAFT_133049 [Gloeophyllum trabeum ATCC 11539]|uniref:Uncharacterized protein n=1 Tax=Gloeophyllum trabeum (strain ATCC 11539 / FP-39264 / Madison 617) TaxID=670483 RepID=S7PVM4_GLOTA|nr:uncharacterized protein GLOTRDRAFT_133049 [Gloeophyllum trabeum ATCC 11539]EPQ51681.1 hypothetical protein GLOTRDRAFT_133049 [Gloeophyllum trabeum ATCC 11539]
MSVPYIAMDPAIIIAVPYCHIWSPTRSEESGGDNTWAFCSSQFLSATQKLLERHAKRDASVRLSPLAAPIPVMPELRHPKPIRAYRYVPSWVDDWDKAGVLEDSPSCTPQSPATPTESYSHMDITADYPGLGNGCSGKAGEDYSICRRPASTISELSHYLPLEVLEELGLSPSASNASSGYPDTPATSVHSSACADPRHVQLLETLVTERKQQAWRMADDDPPCGETATAHRHEQLLGAVLQDIEELVQSSAVVARASSRPGLVHCSSDAHCSSWRDASHASDASILGTLGKPLSEHQSPRMQLQDEGREHREVLLGILNEPLRNIEGRRRGQYCRGEW